MKVAIKAPSNPAGKSTGPVVTKPAAKPPVPTEEQNVLAAKARIEKLKALQAKYREEELEIRTYLADLYHDKEEGSKTVKVGETKFSITRNLTRSISRENAELFSEEEPKLSVEVLSWTPSIKVGEYKKHAEVVDKYIVTKAGPPTIEFK